MPLEEALTAFPVPFSVVPHIVESYKSRFHGNKPPEGWLSRQKERNGVRGDGGRVGGGVGGGSNFLTLPPSRKSDLLSSLVLSHSFFFFFPLPLFSPASWKSSSYQSRVEQIASRSFTYVNAGGRLEKGSDGRMKGRGEGKVIKRMTEGRGLSLKKKSALSLSRTSHNANIWDSARCGRNFYKFIRTILSLEL